ncbi:HupE/UreJ family protein [Paenibacillus sp. GCM10023248]|uniref:HupE/UreJ family protein n=1 Tax=Bacillales TaxID=1385 RepID=UPI00237982AE|nr:MULTISPECIES: HupE/UreJ family protein [Bacillales]MDD9265593.1 HupE/UreJ family protein [Paenibacillus sp. MAHUQ-63]MDR6878831.1 hydrogenase/urease accessory protein HupE [Bacillus sp. 3255]
MKLHWLIMTLAIALFIPSPIAHAHSNNSEGFSTIAVQDQKIDYNLQLDFIELSHAVGFKIDEQNVENLEELNNLIAQNKLPLQEYINTHIAVYANSFPVEGAIHRTSVLQINGRAFAEIILSYPVNQVPENLSIRYNVFFEDSDPSHANMAKVQIGEKQQEFIFTYEKREMDIGEMSFFTSAKQFLWMGLKHIFTGYDHILFVISLLIGAITIRHILALVTAFTIAHSITLALATLEIVQLPSKFIESAIALSIIYIALKNIFQPESKHAPWIAFAFGLIHGFGFAGILAELNLGAAHLATSLLFFNVGIEFGQVLIVSLIFPILIILNKRLTYKWFMPSVSTAVLFFGCVWFFQRAF